MASTEVADIASATETTPPIPENENDSSSALTYSRDAIVACRHKCIAQSRRPCQEIAPAVPGAAPMKRLPCPEELLNFRLDVAPQGGPRNKLNTSGGSMTSPLARSSVFPTSPQMGQTPLGRRGESSHVLGSYSGASLSSSSGTFGMSSTPSSSTLDTGASIPSPNDPGLLPKPRHLVEDSIPEDCVMEAPSILPKFTAVPVVGAACISPRNAPGLMTPDTTTGTFPIKAPPESLGSSFAKKNPSSTITRTSTPGDEGLLPTPPDCERAAANAILRGSALGACTAPNAPIPILQAMGGSMPQSAPVFSSPPLAGYNKGSDGANGRSLHQESSKDGTGKNNGESHSQDEDGEDGSVKSPTLNPKATEFVPGRLGASEDASTLNNIIAALAAQNCCNASNDEPLLENPVIDTRRQHVYASKGLHGVAPFGIAAKRPPGLTIGASSPVGKKQPKSTASGAPPGLANYATGGSPATNKQSNHGQQKTADAERVPVTITRTEMLNRLELLIKKTCDAQSAKWSRGEDMLELEELIATCPALSSPVSPVMSPTGPLSPLPQCEATDAPKSAAFEEKESRERRKRKNNREKVRKLIQEAIKAPLSPEEEKSAEALDKAIASEAKALLPSGVLTSHVTPSYTVRLPCVAHLSPKEIVERKMALRRRHIGLLVSALRTQWTDTYCATSGNKTVPSLELHLAHFQYPKLKAALLDIDSVVLDGSGGNMRAVLESHWKRFVGELPASELQQDSQAQAQKD